MIKSNWCNLYPAILKFWRELADLTNLPKFRILNSRNRREFQEKYTYFGYHVVSTIDLILVSDYVLSDTQMIQYMSV